MTQQEEHITIINSYNTTAKGLIKMIESEEETTYENSKKGWELCPCK